MNASLLDKLKGLQLASYELQKSSEEQRNRALKLIKEQLLTDDSSILKANQEDLKKMSTDDPLFDRLLLNEDRLKGICQELETVISLPDPLGKTLDEYDAPSGIHLKKMTVPIGIIGVIYEARPNVTVDVTALCLKSGNVILLRGSSSAYESNQALVRSIQTALQASDLPADAVQLLAPDHELAGEMMKADEYLDLIIPRGGRSLIERVRKESTVPTIETGASVVHTFIDDTADIEMACDIVFNEKTRRVSVCNALDTILVHEAAAHAFLPALAQRFLDSQVKIHADERCFELLKDHYPSELVQKDASQHFDHEFLALEMNVIIVKDINEAIAHIRKYSLKHSESIVTQSKEHAQQFQQEVDAACVYVNTSTAFSDGAQFGLGAEIGISTQKLHARGPMALKELCSYKWLIESHGLTRK